MARFSGGAGATRRGRGRYHSRLGYGPAVDLDRRHAQFCLTSGVPNENYNQVGISVTATIFAGFNVK